MPLQVSLSSKDLPPSPAHAARWHARICRWFVERAGEVRHLCIKTSWGPERCRQAQRDLEAGVQAGLQERPSSLNQHSRLSPQLQPGGAGKRPCFRAGRLRLFTGAAEPGGRGSAAAGMPSLDAARSVAWARLPAAQRPLPAAGGHQHAQPSNQHGASSSDAEGMLRLTHSPSCRLACQHAHPVFTPSAFPPPRRP